MEARVRRYWLTFEPTATPPGFALGVGVTAWTYDDAVSLIRQSVGNTPFRVLTFTEDVNVQDLDAGRVRPNMLPPNERGIWVPMGA